MINVLPADVATITAYVGQVYTGVFPLIALAIGLPLAFWVIKKVVGLVTARAK